MRKILYINLIIINKKNNNRDFLWAMFYVEKFTFFNYFFIGLIYFIIQQIDNYLRQIVDFIFLPFFLTFLFVVNQTKENEFFFFSLEFFMDNQTSEKNYIHFLTFFFPFFFPPNFLSLTFSGNQTEPIWIEANTSILVYMNQCIFIATWLSKYLFWCKLYIEVEN